MYVCILYICIYVSIANQTAGQNWLNFFLREPIVSQGRKSFPKSTCFLKKSFFNLFL